MQEEFEDELLKKKELLKIQAKQAVVDHVKKRLMVADLYGAKLVKKQLGDLQANFGHGAKLQGHIRHILSTHLKEEKRRGEEYPHPRKDFEYALVHGKAVEITAGNSMAVAKLHEMKSLSREANQRGGLHDIFIAFFVRNALALIIDRSFKSEMHNAHHNPGRPAGCLLA